MNFLKSNKPYLVALFLIAFDLVAYFVAVSLAYFSRLYLDSVFSYVVPLEFSYLYFVSLWWIPAIFIAFFTYEGLYSRRFLFWDEIKEIAKSILIGSLVLFSVVSLAKMSDHVSRLTILLLILYMLIFVPLLRSFAKKLLSDMGLWHKNVLIYGAGETGQNIEWAIKQESNLGWQIVGYLSDDGLDGCDDGLVLGSLGELAQIAKNRHIDIVIIAIPSLEPSRLQDASTFIRQYAKVVYAVPDIKGIAMPSAELYRIYARQLMLLKLNTNLNSGFNMAVKWLLDRVIGLAAMIPLGFIISVLAVLIKLDSPGGVFYSHERVGRNGKKIRVYKFRSMYLDANARLQKILDESDEAKKEWERYHKLKNDPRITKIGHFIRKYSLDELPQVFNVLIGNMSFVGPRPVLETELTEYYKENSKYYLMVYPGITGLWQVSGRNDTTYEMRVALDSWYVQNWSVWLDIVILFKTFRAVIKKDGAY